MKKRNFIFAVFFTFCFYFDDRKQSTGLFAGRKLFSRSFSRFSMGKAWQKGFGMEYSARCGERLRALP